MDWQSTLRELVRNHHSDGQHREPFFLYVFDLPQPMPWPHGIPCHPVLSDFYSICDGGGFCEMWSFYSVAELTSQQQSWLRAINTSDAEPIVLPIRDVVFANDSGGMPIVLNTETGRVNCYCYRDCFNDPQDGWGDWDFASPDRFFSWVFDPNQHDSDWGLTLSTIQSEAAK